MFEGIDLGGEDSPFKILNSLLDKKNIELKTQLNIEQIRVLTILKWYQLNAKYPDNEPIEILNDTMEYYLQLKTSLNRKGRQEIIKGITEVNKTLLEERNILNMGVDK